MQLNNAYQGNSNKQLSVVKQNSAYSKITPIIEKMISRKGEFEMVENE